MHDRSSPHTADEATGVTDTNIIPCPACGRPTRPFRTSPLDYPGTIARSMKNGTCGSCYSRHVQGKPPIASEAPVGELPKPARRTLRRPSKDEAVTLCRWFGRRALLMSGQFVRITPDYYTLRIDGEELDFERFHWEEVLQ